MLRCSTLLNDERTRDQALFPVSRLIEVAMEDTALLLKEVEGYIGVYIILADGALTHSHYTSTAALHFPALFLPLPLPRLAFLSFDAISIPQRHGQGLVSLQV